MLGRHKETGRYLGRCPGAGLSAVAPKASKTPALKPVPARTEAVVVRTIAPDAPGAIRPARAGRHDERVGFWQGVGTSAQPRVA